jgi:hypothetical protein
MRGVILCALLAACGDNHDYKPPHDAGGDAIVDPDAPPGPLTGCLDKPGLPTAPNGQLPCELIPPGLSL